MESTRRRPQGVHGDIARQLSVVAMLQAPTTHHGITMEEREFLPVRTLFISDVHLGSRHSQCDKLAHFLRQFRPESVYLVGDIIDGWLLQRRFRWNKACSDLLQLLMDWADDGTRLHYCPGNHDEFWRHDPFVLELGRRLGVVDIRDEFVFTTIDNRRFLVTHGDQFDFFERSAQWVSAGLAKFYDICLSLNWWCHRLLGGRRQSSPYRLCANGKRHVKRFVKFLSSFESRLFEHVRQRRCEGIICGHLHTPTIVEVAGLTYCNTGDWVEHCTALVEHVDGTLELMSYHPGEFSQVVEMQPELVLGPPPTHPAFDWDVREVVPA